jgi:FkbM family methyltransferase
MNFRDKITGKFHAARALSLFMRYLRNWPEVWEAFRSGGHGPPLQLRGGSGGGGGGGITLYHEEGDDTFCLFREIFIDRCYTRHGFYRPRPTDVVMDLGANVGFFALFLEWYARGIRVHCFEPGGITRQRLERNINANGLGEFVVVHPFALSDRSGLVHLKTAKLAAQRSIFDNEFVDTAGDQEEVRCISLDEAVELTNAEHIDLLKMDVEGAEIEVVEGADPKTWDRIERVAFEFHDRFRSGCRERVTKVLAARGFKRIEIGMTSHLEGMGLMHASR